MALRSRRTTANYRIISASFRLYVSPQQPGLGGRCVYQSAVPAQGGGTSSTVSVFRSYTYGFPVCEALLRSG